MPIELRRDGIRYPVRSTTTALSAGGSYITLTSALSVGIVVDIALWAGETKLMFRGTVRNADATGNGIEFTGINDEQRTCLRRFLEEANAPTLPIMILR